MSLPGILFFKALWSQRMIFSGFLDWFMILRTGISTPSSLAAIEVSEMITGRVFPGFLRFFAGMERNLTVWYRDGGISLTFMMFPQMQFSKYSKAA